MLFDLDGELNIGSWYQSLSLALCSILLFMITCKRRAMYERHVQRWASLSVIFAILSLDEAVAIHERLISPLRLLFHAGGIFYYTWVIPGSLFVLIAALFYLPAIIALPSGIRLLFCASAVVYVSGALGMEMLGGHYVERFGDTMTYEMMTVAEEFLEMAGVLIFIAALLSYMGRHVDVVKVSITAPLRHRGTT
jgi:hypothetical protein